MSLRRLRSILLSIAVALVPAAPAIAASPFQLAHIPFSLGKVQATRNLTYTSLSSRSMIEARISSGSGATGVARAADSGDALARASAQRRAHGLPALRADHRLKAAAQAHADWMARNGVMSHRGKNGQRFVHRMAQVGYGFCFGAENVAYGQRSGAAVVKAWMRSAPHRRAMLDHRARDAAVAKSVDGKGQTYWVLLVGGPC